jgi:hypothetical protein
MKTTMYCFFLFLFLIVGCNDESEQSQVLLKNDLNVAVEVTLYPNSKYSSGDGMYKSSPIYNGSGLTNFSISAGSEYEIFTDHKTALSADSVMRMVFDSVKVVIDTKILTFTHLAAAGYTENLFTSNPAWTFSNETIKAGTQFKSNKIYSSNSYFTFSEDLITK